MEWIRNTLSSVTNRVTNSLGYYVSSEEPSNLDDNNNDFPQNAIVFIAIHGGISNNGEEVTTFRINPNINSVYKFNLAPNRYCAIKSSNDITKYKNIIEQQLTQQQYRDVSFTDDEGKLNSFVEDIKDKIKPIYEKILIDYKRDFLEEYGQKSRTSSVITPLHGNDIMINKNFEYLKETDNNNNPYDWTITLLNSNGQTKTMNLFLLVSKFMKRGVTHHDLNIVTTEEIINYLSSVGVKNILFFDFTCSVIEGSHLLSPRTERALGKIENNLGGKNRKNRERTFKKRYNKVAKNYYNKNTKKNIKKNKCKIYK